MTLKKITILSVSCILAVTVLTGCGCQAEKSPESAPVMEREAPQTENMDKAVETSPETTTRETTAKETTRPTETVVEDTSWMEEVTVDTRPPIEVTIPRETQPVTDYEHYMNMSGQEQEEFFNSFDNEQAFFDWFNAAKDEYEKAHPPVIIDGSTNIELKP